jgi:hypothetical protein
MMSAKGLAAQLRKLLAKAAACAAAFDCVQRQAPRACGAIRSRCRRRYSCSSSSSSDSGEL